MNSRLIELYKEASEFAYKVCQDEGRTGGPSDHIWNTLSTGKFAELIVRECAEVCVSIAAVRAGYNDADGRDTAYSCGDMIKEHFGVEE